MTILVTGGTGLVGRTICGGLAARGHHVRCVDRTLRPQPGVESRVADLRVREAIYPHLAGVEAVVHLANHSNQWRADAQTLLAENTALNTHVFQAAVEAGVRSVIFSSSIQVVSGLPLDDRASRDPSRPVAPPAYPLSGDSSPRPGNAYAASKVLGEQLLRYHAEIHGLAATALRLPFIVRDRRGLAAQAVRMVGDTWAHEGFAWLWAGDLPGLIDALLRHPSPGYRCLLPSAPPMEAIPEVRAALALHRAARVAPLPPIDLDRWAPTPLENLPA
ncbi:MAG: NAD(P)-dependent oxidoreductase [Burkholderiales bacterium]|nr:NAD(P)-dependent oxidoreductase [Opitutaceae bacterium]